MTTVAAGIVDDLVALARIPAPTFFEQRRLEWLEQRLAAAPGRRTRDRAGNLLWTWGEDRPRLLLSAHVDTVFPADTPLDIQREGDELRGPGVGDNAAAIAVAISVLERLLAEEPLAAGGLAFTVAEEGLGNLHGAVAACETLQPEAFIALEGHGLDRVFVDAVGSIRARITISGPGGHSWVDRGRPNAIHALTEVAHDLLAGDAPESFVNIGGIAGGRSINAIADEASLSIEARALDEFPLDRFLARLQQLSVPRPLSLTLDSVGRRPAGRLPRTSALLQAVRAARAELGLPDRLDAASMDANAALAQGIPALALGMAHGSNMHTLAERIDVDSLDTGRRQLELVVRRLLADEGTVSRDDLGASRAGGPPRRGRRRRA